MDVKEFSAFIYMNHVKRVNNTAITGILPGGLLMEDLHSKEA